MAGTARRSATTALGTACQWRASKTETLNERRQKRESAWAAEIKRAPKRGQAQKIKQAVTK